MSHKFEDIISVENLLSAWQEFIRGKRSKPDVQLFSHALFDNIIQLHEELANKTYRHGRYYCFKISDPKPRDISKASVRDRLVHHAVYRILYLFFDRTFISDSYSCRLNKGTHKAVRRLQHMFYQVSRNNTRTVWVLKLDIRKFFVSIDHEILIKILREYIADSDIMWLIEEIIKSFSYHNDTLSDRVISNKVGLPLGNLTSQLFVNIYMNKFDQFMKHKLKVKYYIRYADDFMILSANKVLLTVIRERIALYLKHQLNLSLNPNKIILKTFASGIDFLGWVNFPEYRVLRTSTKKRMLKRINNQNKQSYLGLLICGNTYKLAKMIIVYRGQDQLS